MSSLRNHVPKIPKDKELEKLVAPIIQYLGRNRDEALKIYNALTDKAKVYFWDHYPWAKIELNGFGG